MKKQDAWMDKIFLVLFLVAYHDQLIYPYLIILDVIYPSLVIYSAFLLTGSSLANSTLNSNQEKQVVEASGFWEELMVLVYS